MLATLLPTLLVPSLVGHVTSAFCLVTVHTVLVAIELQTGDPTPPIVVAVVAACTFSLLGVLAHWAAGNCAATIEM